MLRLKRVIAKARKTTARAEGGDSRASSAPVRSRANYKAQPLDEFEKRLVVEALERAGGNQSRAAQILQVSRNKVCYKMAKHGLSRKRPPHKQPLMDSSPSILLPSRLPRPGEDLSASPALVSSVEGSDAFRPANAPDIPM